MECRGKERGEGGEREKDQGERCVKQDGDQPHTRPFLLQRCSRYKYTGAACTRVLYVVFNRLTTVFQHPYYWLYYCLQIHWCSMHTRSACCAIASKSWLR